LHEMVPGAELGACHRLVEARMLGQVARTVFSDHRGRADIRVPCDNKLSSMTAAIFGTLALLAEHTRRGFTYHTR
ncbi:MAG: hypothetical protein ACRENC_02515, partial [Gemmatimonadaceae bacterium]